MPSIQTDAVYTHLHNLSSHCYRKAHFQPGENVAVVGLGAVVLGPPFGARVVGIGNSPVGLKMAVHMGAHAAYTSDDPDLEGKLDVFTDGAGIDLVILTANPWNAYRTSLQIVRPNGRVSIVSLLGRGATPLDFNPLAMEWFYDKGISLIAVSGPAGYLFPAAGEHVATMTDDRFSVNRSAVYILSLMTDGSLEPRRLITHHFHYTEMAYHREKSMLGVIFNWQD